MSRKKAPPAWSYHAVVQPNKAAYEVNLTRLSADRRRPVWEKIKQNSPATASLLQSEEFCQVKAAFEEVFGDVDVSVDMTVVHGSASLGN